MSRFPISVLLVDDEEVNIQLLETILAQAGYFFNKAADGLEAISMLQSLPFDIVLLDIKMPKVDGVEVLRFVKEQHLDTEVIMLTGVHDIKTAVDCMKLGAYYYVTKPYSATDLLLLMERALERKHLVVRNKALRTELCRKALSSHIVTQNKTFLETLQVAARAAASDSTILIQGASGTGKELMADFIHKNSSRKDQPFLAVNCSSIPVTLLESELFGHEKGAFTDASSTRQGLVEIANGGTLFLDEVGEMPVAVQPKLLRFLQTGEYRRVGGNKNLKSDVRIISATNKDLRSEASAQRFREDLMYRLNVITLQLPLLRERKDDIPLLIEHFARSRSGASAPKRMEERALDLLMSYEWPGNIRELQNVVERAVVLSRDELICVDDLALPLGFVSMREQPSEEQGGGVRAGSAVSLEGIQKAHIAQVLTSVKWNMKLASKILDISTRTLYTKIRTYHIKDHVVGVAGFAKSRKGINHVPQ